jgi:hypothetical protein
MTLNHRVPGSSPGAPTKYFKDLALKILPEQFARTGGVISGVTLPKVLVCRPSAGPSRATCCTPSLPIVG